MRVEIDVPGFARGGSSHEMVAGAVETSRLFQTLIAEFARIRAVLAASPLGFTQVVDDRVEARLGARVAAVSPYPRAIDGGLDRRKGDRRTGDVNEDHPTIPV